MDMLSSDKEIPGKRERNRMRNHAAILNSARICFQEKGYENTTIRDLIKKTDLASGTFYNYFRSKQDIFAALLTDFLSGLNENLTRSRRSAESTEEFIRRSYHAVYSATAKDPLVYELAHRNDRAIRDLFGSGILELIMMSLEDDVRAAVTRGILPSVDQEYLCAAFFGVAYETSLTVARRVHLHPEQADSEVDRATNLATALFKGGLPGLTTLP
ncbi:MULTISPECIES: TetR/AcrR family transcriptional regulator [Marinobacter]|uniref:TetR/AcrR family transcriptional regulator n=1 Tax=Marinobacter xiaoshiensis TaxID=3073652 RepID=A0ABU2HHI5_9GAMM|nr:MULTISPECIES: TetR/AcrR family transcriptional regulator [unclassified Marinobacter]MBK1871894.1 TetR/AcrR family transcriptional regulator [Marinobacter sp. 1-3A]MBK1885790.1 TetR/AcrR family transcriptional regulator [Marinobacter sp. DY40_1A1]MDS1309780.1 TetR/AcrR family transcriptional regulator [Marinobacter sp. F60267]